MDELQQRVPGDHLRACEIMQLSEQAEQANLSKDQHGAPGTVSMDGT
jgi:hypothetical protein